MVAAGGVLFDPLCVEAFLDVLKDLDSSDKVRPDLDSLLGGAADCHPVSERRPRPPAGVEPS